MYTIKSQSLNLGVSMFTKLLFLSMFFFVVLSAASLEERSTERLTRLQELFQKLKQQEPTEGSEAKKFPNATNYTSIFSEENNPLMTELENDPLMTELENNPITVEVENKNIGTEMLMQVIDNWTVPDTYQTNLDTAKTPLKPTDTNPIITRSNERSALFKDIDYTVQPGDSLLLIARRLYMNPKKYQDIVDWNSLKSDILKPGQKLILKDVPTDKAAEWVIDEAEAKELYPPHEYYYRVYKVRSGDSLSAVAQKLMGTQKEYLRLAAFNNLDADKFLFVGQKLIIPIKK